MAYMILVTGATGTIGSELVRQLAARGEKVRALTRDPGAAQLPPDVEVVRGDYREPASLDAAMSGATSAFLVGLPGPSGGHDLPLVAAARAAGVGRLVKVSAIATGDEASGPGSQWHVAGERAVRESGAGWAVLRPSTFASNTLDWAVPLAAGDPVLNLTGDGRQGVIDPRDIAEAAAVLLLADRPANRTYTLTGPALLSVPDQAAALADVLTRPVPTRDLTPAEAHAHLLSRGWDEATVQGVLAGSAYVRRGGNAVVTDDVPRLLGRPARTYREWAYEHRGEFGV
ncbi:NAD(P)H-binding protein [Streptomyces acidiscabies]|uniref:NmrA family transcriptional regulator n=1 Tax=Streptomyces acidiscabies TaxID=42234 RepID=A0A0L0K631_9ACTN|nr:NAD(P)H-binding protein [Streptomyces acidiscabies]KND33075.1 NmrA family transcriptional regulator [Streptomyces acidiscabies]